MDDQLDNDLKNRIRQVFDNYEDTTADEGWLLLRERFPEEEKKRPVVWLWWAGVAAGLLLFLSIGVWMLGKKQQANDNLAINPIKQHQHKTEIKDSATRLAGALNTTANKPADSLAASTQKTTITNGTQTHKKPVAATASIQNNIAQSNVPVVKNPAVNNANSTQAGSMLATNQQKQPALSNQPVVAGSNNGIGGSNVAVVQPQVGKQSNITSATLKRIDTAKLAPTKTDAAQYAVNNNVIPNKIADSKPTATDKQFAKTSTPTNAMDAMFKAEQNQPKKPEEKAIDDKRVKFGVYAATFFNYAKGSSNQVNAGAGFTSDIKLSKNFKLSTGVALAQNTLKYGGSATPPNTNAASALTFAAARDNDMLVPAASLPTYKNYNASLVGLDVPINIKYEFNPQKSDAYISAGLSSGTFINEAYTTSYGTTHNSLLGGVTQQTTDQTDKQSFNNFYFAKTLNVSFGLGTAIGKSNRLVIEPFLKYPLQGLGSQQIKFGAGGVNLKFNFTNKK